MAHINPINLNMINKQEGYVIDDELENIRQNQSTVRNLFGNKTKRKNNNAHKKVSFNHLKDIRNYDVIKAKPKQKKNSCYDILAKLDMTQAVVNDNKQPFKT